MKQQNNSQRNKKANLRLSTQIPLVIIWSLVLVMSLHPTNAGTYVATLDPKTEECFEFRTPADKTTVVT